MVQQTINLFAATAASDAVHTAGAQKLTNCFRQQFPTEGTDRQGYKIYSTPGCAEWLDMSATEFRASIQHKNKGYVVMDTSLKSLTLTGTVPPATITTEGTVALSGRASICAINDEIVVCNGTTAYSYKVTADTFATISSGLPGAVSQVIAHNEKILFVISSTNKIYISNISDGRTIQSANNFGVTTDFENLVGALATPDYIYAFGKDAGAVYVDTGDVFAPYTKVSGGSLGIGLAAKFAGLSLDGNGFILAQDKNGLRGMVKLNGPQFEPLPNSDFMVEEINSYADVSDAFCWSHSVDKNTFLNITFPSAEYIELIDTYIGVTWSFNFSTNEWNVMQSYDTSNFNQTRHLAQTVMYLDGKTIVGNFQSSSLMELSKDYFDEDGVTMLRKIRTPHFYASDRMIEITNLRIQVEPGKAAVDIEPKLMLKVSKDWAYTWGDEKMRTVSQAGRYKQQARYSSIGSAEVITLEISFTDSIFWALTGATASVAVYS